MESTLLLGEQINDSLLSRIETRDVLLWVRDLRSLSADKSLAARLLSLPWRLVVCEDYVEAVLSEVQARDLTESGMTRKRGLVQVIDRDPSHMEFPPRCLPIFLLNGKGGAGGEPEKFEGGLRRYTMLDYIRRTGVRDIVVLSHSMSPIPDDLEVLWATDFKCFLTFVSSHPNAKVVAKVWTELHRAITTLIPVEPQVIIANLLNRYDRTFPEETKTIRVRDSKGNFQRIDVTSLDEPERPILERYDLIEEKNLQLIGPEELTRDEFAQFFQDSATSWRGYAAALPWKRVPTAFVGVKNYLRRLDVEGAEENKILFLVSEPGAGGTTMARAIAFDCAREGYPVLLARQIPFVPDPLPVSNFLTRVHAKAYAENRRTEGGDAISTTRIYETPWLIVFDSIHAQYRESELARFRSELEKSGRPACLLVVVGPRARTVAFSKRTAIELAELNHFITLDESRDLGQHLNRFLATYGRDRSMAQWEHFYENHTLQAMDDVAAFWVTLSFWIEGQFDLSESIQDRIYNVFQNINDLDLQRALLRIAAFSTERLPLPERFLPRQSQGWPLSFRLQDARHELAALGLTTLLAEGEKYWAILHDILGRLLINGLYYDVKTRTNLGFETASDSNHLRFLVLEQISQDIAFAERQCSHTPTLKYWRRHLKKRTRATRTLNGN